MDVATPPTAVSNTTPTTTLKPKIIWSRQSNPDPWNKKQKKEWKRYTDLENELIEDGYQRKEQQVELNDYIIDLKHMIQTRKDDRKKQRPVKREETEGTGYLREERFCYTEKPKVAKSFDSGFHGDEFVFRWTCFVRNDKLMNEGRYSEIVDQAITGILQEGKLLNEEFEAQRIADQLRNVRNKSQEEICECCARLYTAESFLYKLINSTLRNEDFTKIHTLGAYCWLLQMHAYYSEFKQELNLYRSTTLTDKMIDEYKCAIGRKINWLAYSSTSKDRQQAEQFGNTLFIIHLSGRASCGWLTDISSLSYYPHEQEVLLCPGYCFNVDQVEPHLESGKYLIYLSSVDLH